AGGAMPGLPRSVEIVDLEVQGVLAAERLQAEVRAGFADSPDRLQARLQVEPLRAHGALSGHVAANLTDLTLLEAAWDGVRDVHGIVDVDLSVRGTPAAPILGGTAVIRSLRASLPPLGVEVTGGSLAARAQDLDEVTFEGHLCTEGCLAIDGRLRRPLQRTWRLNAALAGERLLLLDTPEVRANVAPELALAGDRAGWRLTGTLGVDEAGIVASTPPQAAVRPAPETVVHDRAANRDRN